MDKKICNKCEEIKGIEEFYLSKFSKDGYRNECKNCKNAKQKEYRQINKIKIAVMNKRYRQVNKAERAIKRKIYQQSHRTEQNAYHKKFCSNPKNKLNERISSLIRKSLKGNKNGSHWEKLVDFTLKQLKTHLEKQFIEGMNWELFFKGKIHIDHKIPVSAHNFTKPEHEDFKRCWSLSNLQPMWAKDNLSKWAKLEKSFQPSLLL